MRNAELSLSRAIATVKIAAGYHDTEKSVYNCHNFLSLGGKLCEDGFLLPGL